MRRLLNHLLNQWVAHPIRSLILCLPVRFSHDVQRATCKEGEDYIRALDVPPNQPPAVDMVPQSEEYWKAKSAVHKEAWEKLYLDILAVS